MCDFRIWSTTLCKYTTRTHWFSLIQIIIVVMFVWSHSFSSRSLSLSWQYVYIAIAHPIMTTGQSISKPIVKMIYASALTISTVAFYLYMWLIFIYPLSLLLLFFFFFYEKPRKVFIVISFPTKFKARRVHKLFYL